MDRSDYDFTKKATLVVVTGFVFLVVFLIAVVFTWRLASPKLNLYKSNTEKQSVIKEQEAISEAEVYAAQKKVIAAEANAEARIIEAESIAESQRIIAETLNDDYLTWRFYEVLTEIDGQVIYVPTEANLPITEAERLQEPVVITSTPPEE